MSIVLATSFTISLLTWALPIGTFVLVAVYVIWLMLRTGRSK